MSNTKDNMDNQENELSKMIVYENGDLLDIVKVRQTLYAYWKLNKAEKRAFDRMICKPDNQEKFKPLWDKNE